MTMVPVEIGAGSYGAVFRPPIPASGYSVVNGNVESVEHLVGKVMYVEDVSSKEADIEWAQRDILSSIDPHQSYFLYPLEKQKIDFVQYNIYAKVPLKHAEHNLWQLTMYDGGMSVRKQGEKGMLNVVTVLNYILQVAQSIKRLLDNDLVHLDLHAGNVVSKDSAKCKLIDFGLMLRANKFYTNANPAWTFKYAVNPPEMRLIKARGKGNHNMKYEQELMAKYVGIEEDNLQHIFVNPAFILSYDHLKSTLMDMSDGHHQPKQNKLHYLKSIRAHEKTDIYGLGVAFIEMLSYTNDDDVSVDVVLKVWDIITRMLMPHPSNRICIDRLIYELNDLIHQAKI